MHLPTSMNEAYGMVLRKKVTSGDTGGVAEQGLFG
jgi:hypothetical protein